MEAKFLASVFSFLSIFLAIYAQELVNDGEEFQTAIYYGDLSVNLGEPFSITCIIPISDRIDWVKDDEPITRHNLRHGRDEHSYIQSESAIEGEKHKIEAHISVRQALKVHEGKYQCNTRHTSYHMLQVRSPVDTAKSPFTPPLNANDNQRSTESVYETHSTDGTTHHRQQQQQQQQHRKHHHHHHHQQQLEQQLEQQHQLKKFQEEDSQYKLLYNNATAFDGIGARSDDESDENGGIINVRYLPPTEYNELTTVPWKSSTTILGGGGGGGGGGKRVKQPPPIFPPPRTTMLSSSSSSSMPPQTTVTHYPYPYSYPGEYYHSVTANSAASGSLDQQQQQQEHHQRQQLAKFPLPPTMQPNFQQPSLTTYYQQLLLLPTGQPPMQTMYPPHHPHPQHPVPLGQMPFAPITTSTMLPQVIIPIRKEPDFLVPNYDNATHQLKVYEIRSPLVLSCNITKEGDYVLTWEKNGTDVTKVKELEGRYRIIPAERKFIIDRTDIYDDGLYSCVANNQKKNINVVARVVVRVPSNTGVVEGEKLTIVCTVVGTDPQLYWSIGNLTIFNSTGRYILKPDENHIENAILTMENVSLDDRGEFKCYGRNAANDYTKASEASDASYVRVKGKLAALWPFLGICAEVLILCTIILIYEKRRNKSELEESDTDPQEQKKKRRSYD